MWRKKNYVMSVSSPFSFYSLSGTVSRVLTQHLDCVWNCIQITYMGDDLESMGKVRHDGTHLLVPATYEAESVELMSP